MLVVVPVVEAGGGEAGGGRHGYVEEAGGGGVWGAGAGMGSVFEGGRHCGFGGGRGLVGCEWEMEMGWSEETVASGDDLACEECLHMRDIETTSVLYYLRYRGPWPMFPRLCSDVIVENCDTICPAFRRYGCGARRY